jgi:hypothetical protein
MTKKRDWNECDWMGERKTGQTEGNVTERLIASRILRGY